MKFIQTQTSFRSGYIGERFEGRYDLQEYQNGCRALTNMFVTKSGTAVKAPGLFSKSLVGDLPLNNLVESETEEIGGVTLNIRLIKFTEAKFNGVNHRVFFFESGATEPSGDRQLYIRITTEAVEGGFGGVRGRLYATGSNITLPDFLSYTGVSVTTCNVAVYEETLVFTLKFDKDEYSVPPVRLAYTNPNNIERGSPQDVEVDTWSPYRAEWFRVPNQAIDRVTIQTHEMAAGTVRLTLSEGVWSDYIDLDRLRETSPVTDRGNNGVFVMVYGKESGGMGNTPPTIANVYWITDSTDNGDAGGGDEIGFHAANILAEPYARRSLNEGDRDIIEPGAGKAWRIQSWGTQGRGWPRNVAVDDGRLIFFDVPGKRATIYGSYVGRPDAFTNARIPEGVANFANLSRDFIGSILNTDAYQFTLVAKPSTEITFVSTDRDMIVGTSSGAFLVNGVDEIVGPLSIEARPFYSYPCSELFVELENGMIYASDTKEALILLEYHPSNGGLSGKEISLLASDRLIGEPVDGLVYDPRSGIVLIYRESGGAELISVSSGTNLYAFSSLTTLEDINDCIYSNNTRSFLVVDSRGRTWEWDVKDTLREGDTPVPYLNELDYINSSAVTPIAEGGFLPVLNATEGDTVTVVEDHRVPTFAGEYNPKEDFEVCLLYTSPSPRDS